MKRMFAEKKNLEAKSTLQKMHGEKSLKHFLRRSVLPKPFPCYHVKNKTFSLQHLVIGRFDLKSTKFVCKICGLETIPTVMDYIKFWTIIQVYINYIQVLDFGQVTQKIYHT